MSTFRKKIMDMIVSFLPSPFRRSRHFFDTASGVTRSADTEGEKATANRALYSSRTAHRPPGRLVCVVPGMYADARLGETIGVTRTSFSAVRLQRSLLAMAAQLGVAKTNPGRVPPRRGV